jgi:hypothetical protein
MCGATVESLTVTATKHRTVVSLTDGEVDRSGGARHQRDGRWLVAFADDSQDAMVTLEAEVLDVGRTSFRDA